MGNEICRKLDKKLHAYPLLYKRKLSPLEEIFVYGLFEHLDYLRWNLNPSEYLSPRYCGVVLETAAIVEKFAIVN